MPRYKTRTIKLEEDATGTERLSIPYINISGQFKLESNRFMENFDPDPLASAVRPREVVMRHHPTLVNILLTVRSEDTRLPGDHYTIDEDEVRRGDNPGRYVDHVHLSIVEHSWNRNDVFSDTRVLILSDSGNVVDIPEIMLVKDVTNFNLPESTLQERHRFAHAFEIETGISPELVIFYGLNDQI